LVVRPKSMNSAKAQQKGKIVKAFDNTVWVAILILIFGSLFIGIYKGVKVPHPLANVLAACAFLGPVLVVAISLPLKFLLLRAINFRCTSCEKTPHPKDVAYVLGYSLCPHCNRPFITDPPGDLLELFAHRTNHK